MNFQSFGQMVKGHSRDLDGKSKGKTEQARKVRAKPVGRNQLGVKMQLSLIYSAESFVGAQHANIRRAHSNWAKNDNGPKWACSPLEISGPKSA